MHESGAREELDAIPVANRVVGQLIPLTAMQFGCFKGAAKMGFSIRMCAAAVRLLGPLNVASLRNGLQMLVQRHESLRTRIVIIDGEPMQTIDLSPRFNFDVVDLTDRSLVDAESESKHIGQAFIDQRIDLLTGPLFEAKLIRISHADHALILLMDHIISDAASCDILNRELWMLYSQAERQIPFSLPDLPIQVADYAFWQHQMRDSWRTRDAAHWDARLDGAPAVRIPLDSSLSEASGPAAMLHIPFGKRLTSQLHELAARLPATLPIIVLAIHSIVMSQWCRQNDLLIYFTSHGRRRRQLRNVIGFLANHVFVRLKVSDRESFFDFAAQAAIEIRSAKTHQDYCPFLTPSCTSEVGFNWLPSVQSQRSPDHAPTVDNGLRIRPFPTRFVWPFTFNPFFSETSAGVGVTIHYRPDRLHPATVKRYGRNLLSMAESVVRCPHTRIGSMKLEHI